MLPKRPSQPTAISSITQAHKPRNIPTDELRDFVAEDETAPPTMLYPRDPSLEPRDQLALRRPNTAV